MIVSRHGRWLTGLLTLEVALNGAGGETQASRPPPGPRPQVITTPGGLLLEWYAPPANIAPQADGSMRVSMPGYSQTDQPGEPRLPVASVLIALPPDAAPAVQVLHADEADRPLPGHLVLAPHPDSVRRNSAGDPIGGAYVPASEAFIAQHDPVELELIGIVRGVRLARLSFYPVRAVGPHLRITTHVRASVTFNSVLRAPDSVSLSVSVDPLLASVRSTVINPSQVQPITQHVTRDPPPATRDMRYAIRDKRYAISDTRYAIEVTTPGLTAVTYEGLVAAGFPVGGADPRKLHLTRAGVEIAAEWDGDEDAAFEPGERLLFYAEPRFHRYSAADVYFLSIETTPGLRMSSRSATPNGYPAGSAWLDATAETNALYTPECYCGLIPPGRDGDRWTWDVLTRPGRAGAAYPIQLPTVEATQPATLTLWLIGYTDVGANPDHRVDVSLNGEPLGRVEWNGKQAVTATLPITPGLLLNNTNTVSLTLPSLPGVGVEGMWLDAFSIRYARGSAPAGAGIIFGGEPVSRTYTLALTSTTGLRVYDVTDADHPLRLAGVVIAGNTISFGDPASGGANRYALASDSGVLSPVKLRLASPLQAGGFAGADYVIISPIDFVLALGELIALRQSQGLTVGVEDVQAIYDVFGDGRTDPTAIRAYLADAYSNGSPAPTYVLLVGDGTFDPKQYRAGALPTILPPFLADVDKWAGEAAADNRFVAVDGGDNLPDMLIGRLPVGTLTETQTVVNKIVQYETQPSPGGWNGRVTLVADNPDSAGDFHAQSDVLASTFITAPFTAQPIYFTPPTTTITATHQAILDQWNAGAGLVVFTGHASEHQWAAERLFHLDDVSNLTNESKLPVVLQMTCLTGAFHNPAYATLDEALLRASNGAAVAVWGATGLGVSTGHAELAAGFLQSVYRDNRSILGLAALSGKLTLAANNPVHIDMLDTFNLLGDPATRLNLTVVPQPVALYLPLIRR